MKKIIKLTEKDLENIVKRTIKEEEMMRGYEDLPDNPWNDELQDDLDYDNREQLSNTFKNLSKEILDAPTGYGESEYDEIRKVVNKYMKSVMFLLKAIKMGKNIADVDEDPYDEI